MVIYHLQVISVKISANPVLAQSRQLTWATFLGTVAVEYFLSYIGFKNIFFWHLVEHTHGRLDSPFYFENLLLLFSSLRKGLEVSRRHFFGSFVATGHYDVCNLCLVQNGSRFIFFSIGIMNYPRIIYRETCFSSFKKIFFKYR